MHRSFPIRGESHQLEELSERFFKNSLPRNWLAEKPAHDYGVDLRVELFEGDQATGLELLVQLKASATPTGEEAEVVRLKTATYNLLREKLQVAMLVKYVESEAEAYWLLFRDIPVPRQDQDSFTVHIPKTNKLSVIQWADVQARVRAVTKAKLTRVAHKVTGDTR